MSVRLETFHQNFIVLKKYQKLVDILPKTSKKKKESESAQTIWHNFRNNFVNSMHQNSLDTYANRKLVHKYNYR